jgi:dienelactone hydrolase
LKLPFPSLHVAGLVIARKASWRVPCYSLCFDMFRTFCLTTLAAILPLLHASALQSSGTSIPQPPFVVRALRIPVPRALPNGLEALLVRPNEPGRHPLAVLTHGTPATAEERVAMKPQDLLPIALEFARRGWTTVIVMRRAYGTSAGEYAESIYSCDYPDYMHPAKESARDLRAAIVYLSTLLEVDPEHIIAVGASGGGLATVALTADPPPGLVAAISFAGGSGHIAPDTVCQPAGLVSTFWLLGKTSRLPMLWVYAENDHFVRRELAQSLYHEFTEAGGHATLIIAPPFGSEGHSLFTGSGIPRWTPYVDDFLKAHSLTLRAYPMPLPRH